MYGQGGIEIESEKVFFKGVRGTFCKPKKESAKQQDQHLPQPVCRWLCTLLSLGISTNYTVTLKPFIHNYLIKHNLIEVQIGHELKNN